MGWIQELDIAMDRRPFIKWLVYIILVALAVGLLAFAYVFINAAFNGRGVNVSEGSITPSVINNINDSPSKPLVLKKDNIVKKGTDELNPINKTISQKKQVASEPKIDTSNKSKFNLNGASFNAPVQIGDNNTQNNIGDLPRIITTSDFNIFFNQVTDKNVRIQVDFVGLSATKEMINVKAQILKILSDNGYNNLEPLSGYRILKEEISKIGIQKESDEKYVFLIPPK